MDSISATYWVSLEAKIARPYLGSEVDLAANKAKKWWLSIKGCKVLTEILDILYSNTSYSPGVDTSSTPVLVLPTTTFFQ